MNKPPLKKGCPVVSRVKYFIRVPVVGQASDYTCGVAALQAVLSYWDENDDYYATTLAERLKANTVDGVLTKDIKTFARRHDYEVFLGKDESGGKNLAWKLLKRYIREGKPVIVLLQAWRSSRKISWSKWHNGHFAVVVGYDDQNFYFMDPSTTGHYTYIPIGEFLKRWHDYDGRDKVHGLWIVVSKGKPSFNDRIALKMK